MIAELLQFENDVRVCEWGMRALEKIAVQDASNITPSWVLINTIVRVCERGVRAREKNVVQNSPGVNPT